MNSKKSILVTGIFLLLWVVIHFKMVLNEYRTTREGRYYLWWDLVDIKTNNQSCKTNNNFKDLNFLRIDCRDLSIGEKLNQLLKDFNGKISILPAQTLFYKIRENNGTHPKYATIIWNDFMNQEKSLDKIRRLIDTDSCKEDIAIVLFPTSTETMEGSNNNFGTNVMKNFTQYKIEEYIKNRDLKCMVRKKVDAGNKKFILLRSKDTIHKPLNE